MTNQIVTLSVTQTIAPAPSTLQQTGALISQGGTTGAVNSLTLLTQASDLTTSLAASKALTSLNWVTGVVTATTSAPHGLTTGQVYYLTIAGAVPAAYNGTYAATSTTTTQFTYTLATNPGSTSSPGTYVSGTQTQLVQMVTTFFAQGSSVPIYVLELGPGSVNAGVATLTTWMNNNFNTVYAYLVPREWDANIAFLALIASWENPTAKTYFYVTTTNLTYTSYTAMMKDVVLNIEAPGLSTAEFSLAFPLWQLLSTNPSPTNRVAPFTFRYGYGVTPYPVVGNGALFTAWKAAGVNWIGTGYEGGISTAIWLWGTTADGNPINYWYSVDWLEINIDINLSNAIINGSNNPQSPLYLNQDDINTLQAVAAGTLTSAVTFGLLLGTVVQTEYDGPSYSAALEAGTFAGQAVINAVPFVAYFTANRGDYATGTYNGFSATVTPLRGFEQVTFYINVTNFVAL